MKKEITIKDIASRLGIHHTTVSRALQGSGKVSEATRQRIVDEARRLGYTPNLLAQHFRSGRSKVISLIIPDFKHHFFCRVISALTTRAREKGYMIMIFQSNDDPEQERDIIDSLVSLRVAAVAASVGLRTVSAAPFYRLTDEGIPLVFFDRAPQDTPCSTVTLDNYGALRAVVGELAGRGRRRIAYLTYAGHTRIFKERERGYRDALAEAGLAYGRCIAARQLFRADGYAAASLLYADSSAEKPDAIVCINDETAIGVLNYLKEKGIQVPEEVAVVGTDDNPMGDVCTPALTTLSQSIDRLADTLFELLMKQIEDGEASKEDVVLPMQLVCRETL